MSNSNVRFVASLEVMSLFSVFMSALRKFSSFGIIFLFVFISKAISVPVTHIYLCIDLLLILLIVKKTCTICAYKFSPALPHILCFFIAPSVINSEGSTCFVATAHSLVHIESVR